jgi:pimeloyl-ACP methyl ester carboxylesterase
MIYPSAALSLIHPRLLHSLVLLDPGIQRESLQGLDTLLSTHRRDIWPSRRAAADSFAGNPFYKNWDARVLERWVTYGLRDLPTAIYPQRPDDDQQSRQRETPVTLTTTKHQEVFTFSRPNYDYDPVTNRPTNLERNPDLFPDEANTYPFYRPEWKRVFLQLPHIRPSTLYIFGSKSHMCSPEMMNDKLRTTGIGVGGSGGVAAGRVKSILLEDKGHLLAQEAVTECADAAAEFLGAELGRWRTEEDAFNREWSQKTKVEKATMDERWLKEVGPPLARAPKDMDENSRLKL